MFLLLQCAWHCLTSLDSAHNLTCFIPADDKLYFTLEHTTVLHHNYKLCSTGKQLLNINKKNNKNYSSVMYFSREFCLTFLFREN